MKRIFPFLNFAAIVLLIFSAGTCKNDSPVKPPPPASLNFNVFCDTCGNDLPISREDSVMGSLPPLSISTATKYVSYSPSKRYIAGEFFYNGISPSYGGFSVFIYDMVLNKPIALFMNRAIPYWSPDGTKLSMQYIGNYRNDIYNILTGELTTLKAPFVCTGQHWSLDGKYIFVRTIKKDDGWQDGLYKVDVENSSVDFIAEDIPTNQVFELDSSRLLYPDLYGYAGYIIYDRLTKTRESFEIPLLASLPSRLHDMDLSPDRTKLIATINQQRGIDPGSYALYTIDIRTRSVQKIMENTRFRPEFFPRWGSNNTILTSLFCNVDHSYTTWEIDLKGKLLKKLTYYGIKLW